MIRRMKRRVPAKATTRKPQPTHDPAYLGWVRTQPCAVCHCVHGRIVEGVYYPVESAHTKTMGIGGMSRKSPDRSVIPLCGWCHRQSPTSYHRLQPEPIWAEHHDLDLGLLVAGLNVAYNVIESRRIARQA